MASTDLLGGHIVPTRPLRLGGRVRAFATFGGLGILSVAMATVTLRSAPQPRGLATTVLLLGAVGILLRPALGVYLVAFLTFLGDTQLAWWYPFIKNLSSYESTLYVNDALIVNPLEVYLAVTLIAWGLRRWSFRMPAFERGAFLRPMLVFMLFVCLALAWGLGGGGDVDVALWQVRPLFYVPVVYVLATNLLTSRDDYLRLMWVIVSAFSLESLHALYVIETGSGPEAWRLAALGYMEHSASLHFNTVIIWLGAVFAMGDRSPAKRWLLPILLLPILRVYLLAERRSAVVALIAAALLLAAVLYRVNRRAFWWIVPALGLIGAAYVVAFWNGQGAGAFPAQAVKSVLAPDQLSAADQSSNLYRDIETYNLVATIRSAPLLGLGFGQKFLQIYPLPWIPFIWAEYRPHNSILLMWMNAGIGGFIAMLVLLAAAVREGARAALQTFAPDYAALILTATLYVVMYVIYSYVDIAWDTQSMVYLGIALATISSAERLGSGAPTITPQVARSGGRLSSAPQPWGT